MSTPDWVLSTSEQQELETQEAIVSRGVEAFWKTGQALLTIKGKRLYRATHESFLDYVKERWGLEPRRAQQLMDSGEVIGDLRDTNNCAYLPENEGQARELSRVPREQRAEVWEKAVSSSPEGKVTAKVVKQAAAPFIPTHAERISRNVKGWPTEQHKAEAFFLLLHTRDPRGTIARFLSVADSLVSNVAYIDTHSRSALEENREERYLAAGERLGMSEEAVRQFLSDTAQTVRQ